jgi:hypothetical protein
MTISLSGILFAFLFATSALILRYLLPKLALNYDTSLEFKLLSPEEKEILFKDRKRVATILKFGVLPLAIFGYFFGSNVYPNLFGGR